MNTINSKCRICQVSTLPLSFCSEKVSTSPIRVFLNSLCVLNILAFKLQGRPGLTGTLLLFIALEQTIIELEIDTK